MRKQFWKCRQDSPARPGDFGFRGSLLITNLTALIATRHRKCLFPTERVVSPCFVLNWSVSGSTHQGGAAADALSICGVWDAGSRVSLIRLLSVSRFTSAVDLLKAPDLPFTFSTVSALPSLTPL